jgi:hypothetical protein
MTVIDKHRIRQDHWMFATCERCNAEPVNGMVREKFRIPDGRSGGECVEMWVCPKCGYTKRL